VADIKFCGMTRPEDAAHAASLGASYIGVIFAGGPRNLSPDSALDVLSAVPPEVQRVGVFADQDDRELLRIAEHATLDVVQLHAPWDPERITRLRKQFEGEIWPVVRVADAQIPEWISDAFELGDAVVLDAYVAGALGGTGVALPWAELSTKLTAVRTDTPVVLAGGLRPENVAIAIAALSPEVVDVSSGVESAPGIKDHDRVRAFRDAVANASQST
jgi:phosphoribosylanthranilate isomerase